MATTKRTIPAPPTTAPPGAGTVDAPGSLSRVTAGEPPGAPASVSLDALAQQVYSIIRQRLAVERERSGATRGIRPW